MSKENNNTQKHEKNVLHLTINEKTFKWNQQYITGAEIRKLGGIQTGHEIFLGIKRPWEDELITDTTKVDLARPGIEHFFSKKRGEERLVTIYINDHPYEISRGKHSVPEIKNVGKVPSSHELEEVINGTLTPLADDGTVLIKGGEIFFSHVRDGSSS
jgi:hypothetical protein